MSESEIVGVEQKDTHTDPLKERAQVHADESGVIEESSQETKVNDQRYLEQKSAALLNMLEDLEEGRKKVEESERRFRTIYEGAKDGIVLIDPETGLILECNPMFEQLAGRGIDQLCTMKIWELQHPKKFERAREKFEGIKEKGKGSSDDLEFMRPDGTIVMIEFVTQELTIENNSLLLSMVRDITERKQAEEELKQSEKRFGLFMHNFPGVAFITDPEGTTVFGNKFICEFYGCTPEEYIGKRIEELNNTDIAARLLEQDRKVLSENKSIVFEDSFPDSSYWITHKFPIEYPDGRRFIGGFGIDITERKRAEEAIEESRLRLELAARAGNVGMWEWNTRTNKTFFSPEWKRQIGYQPEEIEDTYEEWEKRIHPDDHDRVLQTLQDYIEARLPYYNIEFRLQHKDGSYRWIIAQGELLQNESGERTRMLGCHIDITGRKQSELALEQSEERFRLLAKNMPGVIYLCKNDKRWSITYINEQVEQLTGYSHEKIQNNEISFAELYHPDDVEQIYKKVEQALNAKKAFHLIYRIKHQNGKWVWIEEFGVGLYENNEVVSIEGVLTDITERKQAEEALRESEERFSAMFEHMNSGVAVYEAVDGGEDFVFKSFNPAAEKITRLVREQVIGKRLLTLFPNMDKAGLLGALQRVWATGKMELLPPFYYKDDVREGWRKNCIYKLPSGEVVALFDDVTERKQAEDRLQLLSQMVEQAGDGIVYTDTSFNITYVNPAAERLFGWKSEELIGQTPGIFNAEPNAADIQSEIYAAVSAGQEYLGEAENRRKDGSLFHCQFKVSPIVDENLNIIAYMASQRDITGQKLAEQEIINLNEQLEQKVVERTVQLEATNKELEAFAYSVSHDLRAPARRMESFATALIEDFGHQLPENGNHYVDRILSSSRFMSELIDSMLQLSRLSRKEMKLATVDLSALARKTVESLRERHPERDVNVIIEEGLTVTADDHLLAILLDNVIGNAWKFTQNKPDAEIEFGSMFQDRNVILFVKDNGAGFDMKYVDNLFSPFKRLHTDSEFSGIGIGMATVQRIVHRHDGNIWAEGQPEMGATIYFTL